MPKKGVFQGEIIIQKLLCPLCKKDVSDLLALAHHPDLPLPVRDIGLSDTEHLTYTASRIIEQGKEQHVPCRGKILITQREQLGYLSCAQDRGQTGTGLFQGDKREWIYLNQIVSQGIGIKRTSRAQHPVDSSFAVPLLCGYVSDIETGIRACHFQQCASMVLQKQQELAHIGCVCFEGVLARSFDMPMVVKESLQCLPVILFHGLDYSMSCQNGIADHTERA